MTKGDLKEPVVISNDHWAVTKAERVSACDNRPGLKKMYVHVVDAQGKPLPGVKVRFDTEPSEGIVYDHPNFWGKTDKNGYVEWNSLGVATRYLLWMEDDKIPLIENIRVDLGNEYCNPGSRFSPSGWIPINKPGVYSYRFIIQARS